MFADPNMRTKESQSEPAENSRQTKPYSAPSADIIFVSARDILASQDYTDDDNDDIAFYIW